MADLTSRGPTGNNAALLPALPVSTATDPSLRQWQESVREWLEVRLGARGDFFERAVTFRDYQPQITSILRRLDALEEDSTGSVEDCCKALRLQIAALWAAIYAIQGQLSLLDSIINTTTEITERVVDDPGGDPYWANVVLLVQGGTASPVQDLSTYASTAAITSGIAFDNTHQVFGVNPLRPSERIPSLAWFTSTGMDTRFTRPSGMAYTIELFTYWTSLDNLSTHFFFLWDDGVGNRVMELGFSGSSGNLRLRINNASELLTGNLAANTLWYIQLTISGNTYYLDAGAVPGDGTTTQRSTGTAPISNAAGTNNFRVGTHYFPDSTASSGGLWMTPLRVTRGVARPRGRVPSGLFPTTSGATSGSSGNARFYENNAYTDVSDPVPPSTTDLRVATFSATTAQVGVAHVSNIAGENTQVARTGKVYLEFSGSLTAFIGVLANSGFSSGFPTTAEPFGTAGYYCISNINYRGRSPGTITNGTAAADGTYNWNWSVGPTLDRIGMAIDWAAKKVWFSKNGTWLSGDPTAGTSPTFTLPDANFTIVVGAYPESGVVPVVELRARSGLTAMPPSGFTWYA